MNLTFPPPIPAPPASEEPSVMGPLLAAHPPPYPRPIAQFIAQYDHLRKVAPQLLQKFLIGVYGEYARRVPAMTSPPRYR